MDATTDLTRTASRRWWALGALVLAVLAVGLDGTILSVALPTLGRSLDASTGQLQWFVAAYTLVFAAALVPGGMLGSDRYGRKKMLIVSLLVGEKRGVGLRRPRVAIGWGHRRVSAARDARCRPRPAGKRLSQAVAEPRLPRSLADLSGHELYRLDHRDQNRDSAMSPGAGRTFGPLRTAA